MTSAPMLPSTWNCTPAMPKLLVAVAETVTVPETVEPFAGAVMETAGAAAVVRVKSPLTLSTLLASFECTR